MNNKQDLIFEKADEFAKTIYCIAQNLPKHEQFGLTSQLRRAALSVPLNVVEGYARQSKKSQAQFMVIAYGSLQETRYIIKFAVEQCYVDLQQVQHPLYLAEHLSKMMWRKIQTLRSGDQK
jgi:four helix bundle protein